MRDEGGREEEREEEMEEEERAMAFGWKREGRREGKGG